MFDRLTNRAANAVGLARRDLARVRRVAMGPENILFALVLDPTSVAGAILAKRVPEPKKLRDECDRISERREDEPSPGQLPFTAEGRCVLDAAARTVGPIGTGELLLALVEAPGETASLLARLGFSAGALREEVRAAAAMEAREGISGPGPVRHIDASRGTVVNVVTTNRRPQDATTASPFAAARPATRDEATRAPLALLALAALVFLAFLFLLLLRH